jgi:hypothetical protein
VSHAGNVLRSSSIKTVRSGPTGQDRVYRFERLMTVSIRHSFYNASDELCPDFRIQPTAASCDLMESLGLLFRDEGSGFSVILDKRRLPGFLNYLRNQPGSSLDGVWNRLSFALAVRNPAFVNITDMPIGTACGSGAFYMSNMTARQTRRGTIRLNPGTLTNEAQVPVTGSQYRWVVKDPRAQSVVIQDISGAIVGCEPVYWPSDSHAQPQCPGPDPATPGVERRDVIYLNFSAVPEDKYQVEERGPTGAKSVSLASTDVIYTFSGAPPLFFIDLLFTNPGISTGVYPVENLDEKQRTTVTPTQYQMEFRHRSTVWNYYVVSTGAPLSHLQIETVSQRAGRPPVTFSGPTRVSLPDNKRADLFVSDTAIPLQERSASNFQLLGRAGGLELRNGVLMNRLPVASSQQVIPHDSDYATGEQDGDGEAAAGPSKHDFSDIYVYV